MEYHIGMSEKTPTEYDRFTSLVDRVLSVPKTEIQRREDEYKAKPRPKKGASRASGA